MVLLLAFNACNTAKFLKEEEFLLRGNSIKFKSKEKIKNKPSFRYQLAELYQQNSNRKFFGIPREWFYFKTAGSGDTTKLDKWIRRVIAEPPTIYSDSLRFATEKAIVFYLNKRGYYNAEVFSDKRTKGKKIYIDYYVNPRKQFTIDSVSFFSPDSTVNQILDNIHHQTALTTDAPIDVATFEKEKERITTYLRDNGYANFYPYHVSSLEADTTVEPQKANLFLTVDLPANDSIHRIFRVGKIEIFPNFSPLYRPSELYHTEIDNYHFYDTIQTFKIKPKTVINAIYLKEGELYSEENYDKTYQRLSSLGVYKFIRIRQNVDSIQQDVINFRIELTPDERMEFNLDFELSYTNRNAVSALTPNLFGTTISPSFSHKNLLHGAELSVTNLSAGVEFNPNINTAGNRFWNTVDFGIQTELTVPKFLDYFKLWKLADKIRLGKKVVPVEKRFYTALKETAVSRISTGYNYILILDLYQYNLFNTTFGYEVRRGQTTRTFINHIGIDFLEPRIKPAFRVILDENPFLERSFGQQLFFSALFRNFNMVFNSRPKSNGEQNYFSIDLETAGGEVWAVNSLTNAIRNARDTFGIGNTKFSQYISLKTDFRYYKQITPKRGFGTRFYFGIARPFGFSSDVPFIKQFAVGGPNSIRGWVERGLGPGGYLDTLAHSPDNRFRLDSGNRLRLYQTGDLRIEFNAEYRFNLYWLLDGAFFLDAGNIWTIQSDPSRCGSQFLFRSRTLEACEEQGLVNDPFYRQIAIGSGFGFRLDLTYFILRLDMGVRLRYPFPLQFPRTENITEGDYWEDFNGWGIRDVNFNLGFGYPF